MCLSVDLNRSSSSTCSMCLCRSTGIGSAYEALNRNVDGPTIASYSLPRKFDDQELMQTFTPYSDFEATARALDTKRLGKQRVEVTQIVRALTVPGYAWASHPAVLMWKGYEEALGRYGLTMCRVWTERGFADTCAETITADLRSFGIPSIRSHEELSNDDALPRWLFDPCYIKAISQRCSARSQSIIEASFPVSVTIFPTSGRSDHHRSSSASCARRKTPGAASIARARRELSTRLGRGAGAASQLSEDGKRGRLGERPNSNPQKPPQAPARPRRLAVPEPHPPAPRCRSSGGRRSPAAVAPDTSTWCAGFPRPSHQHRW